MTQDVNHYANYSKCYGHKEIINDNERHVLKYISHPMTIPKNHPLRQWLFNSKTSKHFLIRLGTMFMKNKSRIRDGIYFPDKEIFLISLKIIVNQLKCLEIYPIMSINLCAILFH